MKKQSIDTYFISINVALLATYFFVFQSQLANYLLKMLVLISFIGLCVSLLLLIWHTFRHPVRQKVFEEFGRKAVEETATRIEAFIKDIIRPTARLKAQEEIRTRASKIKNEEEYRQFQADLKKEMKLLKSGKLPLAKDEKEEKATEYVLESFLNNLASDSRESAKKAFNRPLKEKYAKLKFTIDMIARYARRQVFVASALIAAMSIVTRILMDS